MSEHYIDIRGIAVSLKRRYSYSSREKVIFLENLISEIQQPSLATPILAPNTRFHQRIESNMQDIYVLEFPPQVRTITWLTCDYPDLPRAGRRDYHYSFSKVHLAFPYTIFIIEFLRNAISKMFHFYRVTPLKSISDTLMISNLPNVWDILGRVCIELDSISYYQPMHLQIQEALGKFWTSQFKDDDLTGGYDLGRKLDFRISSIDSWEATSKINPRFMLTIPWQGTDYNLEVFMEHLHQRLQNQIQTSQDLARIIYRTREVR